MTNVSCVHLIEKNDRLRPLERGSQVYESGYWVIAPATADRLVGGKIYLHRSKSAPSFFGGQIQACRVEPEGEWQGRVVFTFLAEQACKGVAAGPRGWGNEKKLTWSAETTADGEGPSNGRHRVEAIIKLLAAARQRATYAALGGLVGLPPRSVMAGREMNELNSWIVSATTGLPTGYPDCIMVYALKRMDSVLSNPGDLNAWLIVRGYEFQPN